MGVLCFNYWNLIVLTDNMNKKTLYLYTIIYVCMNLIYINLIKWFYLRNIILLNNLVLTYYYTYIHTYNYSCNHVKVAIFSLKKFYYL